MQSDSSEVISIIDNPYRLNTSYLYSTIDDGVDTYKTYSQQEFLVLNELDFSKLENFRIICFNEEQEELLKLQLGNDPICEHITTDEYTSSGISVFHRTNRTISIDENENVIRISTNYRDPSSIVIESNDIDGLEIFEKSNITNISRNKISAFPSISFVKPNIPVTVRFMDLQKYDSNSWIIYSNKREIEETKPEYSIITTSLITQFELEMSKLQIQISKTLFKTHMLNSYHGIGHTMRVLWNSFVIASINNSVNNSLIQPILYAALIHDLGKQSDTEGEIHGEKSAHLYKDKIENCCAESASLILEAVKYHSIDDSKTPANVQCNKIWEILKDADALDRSRLPGRGCNPSFLRNDIFSTEDGKQILSLARELPVLTIDCKWESPVLELTEILNQIIS